MKLLLIRHGEAVDATPDNSDGSRWLTPRGRAETAVTARHVAAVGPLTLVTSPLVRAVQTAEIIAAHAAPPDSVTVLAALATGDIAAIGRFIEAARTGGTLALVGHEPTLSQVLVALLKPARWSGFEKSAAVALERDGGPWRLGWIFLARSATTLDRLPG
jgi:phosphohistidine phosphatase